MSSVQKKIMVKGLMFIRDKYWRLVISPYCTKKHVVLVNTVWVFVFWHSLQKSVALDFTDWVAGS